ncbi:hypothetical protein [Parapedobacter sp. DT-150]|uniref:hypothetical protein n=1 Tax=Parapedobacter sp. DT-150 TaxID=3396162 RepID=UPI003F1C5FCB
MWIIRRLAILVGCCLAIAGVWAQGTTPFANGEAHGKIKGSTINEASGLVAAVAHPRHFWTHNDSGDKARIFLMDDSARHQATFYLQGIEARDWEDIGMMEQQGRHYLIVGDIGDNQNRRPNVQVHVFEEPQIDVQDPAGVPDIDTIPRERIRSYTMRYEDGPRDAESLFFDPVEKRLYLISKRDLAVGLYVVDLPAMATDTLTLHRVASLPFTFITAADISPDGTELLMKNLLGVFYWKRNAGESVSEMMSRTPIRLPYEPEPQGEAIAFSRDGSGYYTLSEAPFGLTAVLYFYRRL